MTEKEIFVMLAKAYIEDYNKSCAVYAALHPLGITLEDEERPLVSAIERILETIVGGDPYITEALFDINKDGYTIYYTYNPIDEEEKETEHRMSSIEELYDFYKS
jgi:hypothetical protein